MVRYSVVAMLTFSMVYAVYDPTAPFAIMLTLWPTLTLVALFIGSSSIRSHLDIVAALLGVACVLPIYSVPHGAFFVFSGICLLILIAVFLNVDQFLHRQI